MMIISRPSRRFSNWWLVGLVALVLFGGSFFSRNLSGLALAIGRPFWWLRDVTASLWQTNLVAENRALKQRVSLLETEARERVSLLDDNDQLRALLGRRSDKDKSREVARVLVGWRGGTFDLLALDLGRDNSARLLAVGDFVLAGGNVWLGEVVEVYGRSSKVRLLSQAGQVTPAALGTERLPVTLTGRGGGNFGLTLPAGVNVRVGDTAVASGTDRDWLVAVVGAITINPATSEQEVFLRQPLQASTLKYVELASH